VKQDVQNNNRVQNSNYTNTNDYDGGNPNGRLGNALFRPTQEEILDGLHDDGEQHGEQGDGMRLSEDDGEPVVHGNGQGDGYCFADVCPCVEVSAPFLYSHASALFR
jgi:hypothetical protein